MENFIMPFLQCISMECHYVYQLTQWFNTSVIWTNYPNFGVIWASKYSYIGWPLSMCFVHLIGSSLFPVVPCTMLVGPSGVSYGSTLAWGCLSMGIRDHFVHAPRQWEMTLHCNIVSRWLGAYTKWSLGTKWLSVATSSNNIQVMPSLMCFVNEIQIKMQALWCHQMETFSTLLAFVRGIHWSLVISPHKGQPHGALMFSLICAWTNGWAVFNHLYASDLRCHRTHHDMTVMRFLGV